LAGRVTSVSQRNIKLIADLVKVKVLVKDIEGKVLGGYDENIYEAIKSLISSSIYWKEKILWHFAYKQAEL
ncbi:10715_t:CDS:2, partial [Funneliformis geosporum]